MKQRVIGLMSGTSVDGIDAALVELAGATTDLTVDFLTGITYPYPIALRERILAVCEGAALSIAELAELDDAIARQFAQAALEIQHGYPSADLIGSHGQTVYHRPPPQHPTAGSLGYSLQLGRGAVIAEITGITTISNFRAADLAASGQGAPLVSPIDVCLLSHPTHHRCVQNIGGIGNVTYLPASQPTAAQSTPGIRGWDTGPGNVLIDLAVQFFTQGAQTYDQDGAWAATGTPCLALVEHWLQDPFFQQPPPRSTGRELFSPTYLQRCLTDAAARSLSEADILATLTEFTVAAIAHSYTAFLPQLPDQVIVGGGGSKNSYLKQRLQAQLGQIPVLTTDELGLNADFKEAIAFAILAYWRYQEIPGNLPAVTGAKKSVLLGEIHPFISEGA